MISFTLKNIQRDKEQDFLYNLYQQTFIDNRLETFVTYVKSGEEMRLDKISKRLYGSTGWIEELMQINNILNIWNIKVGDKIEYTKIEDLSYYRSLEKMLDETFDKLAKPNKNTRVDKDRKKSIPTIRPKGLENLVLDKKNKKITIKGNIS